ncbi:outer membrane autotransporter protein [Bartonella japonica]|uniref:Outer membrane autotransporter protein n=1 Tax=Bartonella japonica TaxID=357761 RepID=A0ABV2FPL8_9HYPH
MINVFKNRTRLCALTTSVLFFFQGVNFYVTDSRAEAADGNECKIERKKSNNGGNPIEFSPVVCKDGEKHKMGWGIINVDKFGDNALHVEGKEINGQGGDVGEDIISTKTQGENKFFKRTTVKAKNVSMKEENIGPMKLQYNTMGVASAVFAELNGHIELEELKIRGFLYGIEAEDGGIVSMKKGGISAFVEGVRSDGGSFVSLDKTDVEVSLNKELSEQNNVELEKMGLFSAGKSGIVMKSGSLTFPEGGIGVASESGGFVSLEEVDINIKKAEKSENADSVLFYLNGGFVSLHKGKFSDSSNSDASVALWIRDSINNDGSAEYESVVPVSVAEEIEKKHLPIFSGIRPLLRSGSTNSLPSDLKDRIGRSRAVFESSDITINGNSSYGIHFDGSDDNNGYIKKKDTIYTVLLKGTTLKVPDSAAIYSDGMWGAVIVKEKSVLSGDLLLRTKQNAESNLSIFVDNSEISGEIHLEKDTKSALYLSNNSKWNLTKSKGNHQVTCNITGSCVSSINLSDSSIMFNSQNGNNAQKVYQTLRIGNGNGKSVVYSSAGDSKVYLNVNLGLNNAANSQISDRLLIHGDVSGKTTIHVSDDSGNIESNAHKHHSIPVVQVYGKAKKDSFVLSGGYVTLGGDPYKYVLHAYGPEVPPKMGYFDKTLLPGSTEVWDFRLEDEHYTPLVYAYNDNSHAVSIPGRSLLSVSSTDDVENGESGVEDSETDVEDSETGNSEVSSVDPSSSASVSSEISEGVENGVPSAPVTAKPAPTQAGASSSSRGRVLLSSSGGSGTSKDVSSSSATSVDTSGKTGSSGRSDTSPVARVDGSSGKENISVSCNDIKKSDARSAETSYVCSGGEPKKIQNLVVASKDEKPAMHVKNTTVDLESADISGKPYSGTSLSEIEPVGSVLAEEGGKVVLNKKSAIKSSMIGLETRNGGEVKIIDGTISVHQVGALAKSGSSIHLNSTDISVEGPIAAAGLSSNGGEIIMNSGSISFTGGVAVNSDLGGSVKLSKVKIINGNKSAELDAAKKDEASAFLLSGGGSIDFVDGSVVTSTSALRIKGTDGSAVDTVSHRRKRSANVRSSMNRANVESSTVKVDGEKSYGIHFDGAESGRAGRQNRSAEFAQKKKPVGVTGEVSLKKTTFEVAKSVAIYANNSGGLVSLENKTILSGDSLLRVENSSNILVLAKNSIISGSAHIDSNSYAKIDLENGSEWILKRGKYSDLKAQDSQCVDSCVSSVSLVNSGIKFLSSETEGKYQTLQIGKGEGTVYKAQGEAVIYLNARLNPNDQSGEQVTDRLLIHGNVEGKTTVHVAATSGSAGGVKNGAHIAHSVPVIQVYGKAEKDSFQLKGGYIALQNSPYKYTLRSYGPETTSKQKSVHQRFMKDGGEFWDFRLENQYVKSNDSRGSRVGLSSLPKQVARSVVPQVPTYLLLPNSIFHAGLMDINNQNKQLEAVRISSGGTLEARESPALYLRGYGGNYRYASDLSALEYGYGGEIDYNGVEAGVLLQAIESVGNTVSFGVMGSYGKLSLQPLEVEQSQKSAFDKWTASAYGTVQHDAGFYVDGLFSYGLFKGDVLTLARGKTATLKGNPLSVSLTSGQSFATGYKGVVLEPQAQVVYQHLQFSKARDIDNFDIEMGTLDQWVARVGGRLSKLSAGSEGVNVVAFYGKLYFAHGFGGKQTVHFKDAFQLGAFGSSLEAGLGFNAKIDPKFSLHGDVLYQHKLNKAGFSGASFSGGVRYQF